MADEAILRIVVEGDGGTTATGGGSPTQSGGSSLATQPRQPGPRMPPIAPLRAGFAGMGGLEGLGRFGSRLTRVLVELVSNFDKLSRSSQSLWSSSLPQLFAGITNFFRRSRPDPNAWKKSFEVVTPPRDQPVKLTSPNSVPVTPPGTSSATTPPVTPPVTTPPVSPAGVPDEKVGNAGRGQEARAPRAMGAGSSTKDERRDKPIPKTQLAGRQRPFDLPPNPVPGATEPIVPPAMGAGSSALDERRERPIPKTKLAVPGHVPGRRKPTGFGDFADARQQLPVAQPFVPQPTVPVVNPVPWPGPKPPGYGGPWPPKPPPKVIPTGVPPAPGAPPVTPRNQPYPLPNQPPPLPPPLPLPANFVGPPQPGQSRLPPPRYPGVPNQPPMVTSPRGGAPPLPPMPPIPLMQQLATAAPVIGAAIAAIAATKAVFVGATRAVGQFATAMVNPSNDPSEAISAAAGSVKKFGDVMTFVIPPLGIFASVVGEATDVLGKLMKSMDGMVDRYKKYSPELATASAFSGMRQVLGDLRRAQTAGPALANYEMRRAQLQDKIEDAKVRFMVKILPLVEAGMALFEKILPMIELTADVLAKIAETLGLTAGNVDDITKWVKALKDQGIADATTTLLKGYVGPESAADREARIKRGETGGVIVPGI